MTNPKHLIADHLRSNVIGYLALFLVLSMGTAYATHPGGPNTVSSGDIIDNEVKSADIEDLGIQTADLGQASVNAPKIKDGAVKNADLSPNAVNALTIEDGSVKAAEVDTGAVNSDEIASDAVDAAEITPGAVQSAEIADNAVKAPEIDLGAVNAPEIGTGAVNSEEIETGAVNSAEVAPGAIGTSEMGNIPTALVTRLPDTPVTDSTRTSLFFDTELEDTAGLHEGTSALLTAPVDGIYSIAANLYWEPDSTPSGFRETAIVCLGCELLPGSGPTDVFLAHLRSPAEGLGGGQPSGPLGQSFLQPDRQPGSLSTIAKLSAGSQIHVVVWQNSGGPQTIKNHLNDASDPIISPSLSMTWIAPRS